MMALSLPSRIKVSFYSSAKCHFTRVQMIWIMHYNLFYFYLYFLELKGEFLVPDLHSLAQVYFTESVFPTSGQSQTIWLETDQNGA